MKVVLNLKLFIIAFVISLDYIGEIGRGGGGGGVGLVIIYVNIYMLLLYYDRY